MSTIRSSVKTHQTHTFRDTSLHPDTADADTNHATGVRHEHLW